MTVSTLFIFLATGVACYLAYIVGEMREAQRQAVIQDQLTEKLVAAYRNQK